MKFSKLAYATAVAGILLASVPAFAAGGNGSGATNPSTGKGQTVNEGSGAPGGGAGTNALSDNNGGSAADCTDTCYRRTTAGVETKMDCPASPSTDAAKGTLATPPQ